MKKKASKKPAPKLNVRIDPSVLRRFKKECDARGLKLQAATEHAILDWLALRLAGPAPRGLRREDGEQ